MRDASSPPRIDTFDSTPSVDLAQSRFVRACRRQPVDKTPIWLMRQAGRYLPEYQALRARFGFLELAETPELACQITLMPVDAFDMDAAIIFSDILLPLAAMGLGLEFLKGEGPSLRDPIRSAADVARLRVPAPAEAIGPTLEAIRLVRRELEPRGTPLIGFVGAPFTLAAYAVEGGASRNYERVKGLMMSDRSTWDQLMGKLADAVGQCLVAQAEAGVSVLQVFDSWAGALSPSDYRAYVLPHSRRAIDIARTAGVPIVHFSTGTAGMLDLVRDAGGDVIGVDWRIDLATAWERLGPDVAVQGNLDPIALQAAWPELESRARDVLDQAAGRSGHIFNLGHGVLPATAPDAVKRLVEFVHEYTS